MRTLSTIQISPNQSKFDSFEVAQMRISYSCAMDNVIFVGKIHARDLTNPFVLTDGLKAHLEVEVSRRSASAASYLARPPVSTPLWALIALLRQVRLLNVSIIEHEY